MYTKKQLYIAISFLIVLGLIVWFMTAKEPRYGEIHNVVLISIDTCRADYLGCYGYPRNTTPNIDAMAETSMLYENAYAPTPLTLPSHTTMLTGTIPVYHGVHDNGGYRVGQDNITLAEILKEKGFTTGAIVSSYILNSQFGLDQGFDTYNDYFEKLSRTAGINERKAEETSRIALDWIEKNKELPFFLFLHYYDPHINYEPPFPYDVKYSDNPYAGEIAYVDHCIGKVIQKLKDFDLYESTLIVLTSDHGEMLEEHGEYTHAYYIYQSAIKVPLIIKLPGQDKAKRFVKPVGLVDIVPTVCSLLDIAFPTVIQHGTDLSAYFKRNSPSPDRNIYCESLTATKYEANSLLGIVNSKWKYIQTTRPELYNIIDDRSESKNLIDVKSHQARILQDDLRKIVEESSREMYDNKLTLNDESKKRLESLGYVAYNTVTEEFQFKQDKDDPKDLLRYYNDSLLPAVLMANDRYDEAKVICEKLDKEIPNVLRMQDHLADIAIAQKNNKEAIRYINQAIKLSPSRHQSYAKLGAVFLHMERTQEAIEQFEEALNRGSEDSVVYNRLAVALLKQKKVDQAIIYFEKAISVDPLRSNESRETLGGIFAIHGKFDQAVNQWSLAIKQSPENHNLHNYLADVFVRQHMTEDAITEYGKSLKIKSDQPLLHNKLAEIYISQKNIATAVNHWDMALKMKPDWVDVLNNLAWCRAVYTNEKTYDPDKALQMALPAAELTEYKAPKILDTLSVAYAAIGRFPEAINTLEKAIDIAISSEQNDLLDEMRGRMTLYENNQPYRE